MITLALSIIIIANIFIINSNLWSKTESQTFNPHCNNGEPDCGYGWTCGKCYDKRYKDDQKRKGYDV